MVLHPAGGQETRRCAEWCNRLLLRGERFVVPEICDYELRRELLRSGKLQSVKRLDEFARATGYLPLDTETMLRAAALWAEQRNAGAPTADAAALDGDVILAAQAQLHAERHKLEAIIVTTNVGHLGRMAKAVKWDEPSVA